MSLSGIRSKLQTGLQTISGLNTSSVIPDTITLPLALVYLKPGNPVDYDYTSKNASYVYHFEIEVLVNKGASVAIAQTDLDAYIDPSDAHSVKTAIEAINFGTDANTKQLIGSPAYGRVTYGNTEYLGIMFSLDIWV